MTAPRALAIIIGMKKLTYPARVGVQFDRDMGKKLDFIAVSDFCSRPGAILKAVAHYHDTLVSARKQEQEDSPHE